MNGSEYLKMLRQKEVEAKQEGIKQIIMDFRFMLDRLNIIKFTESSFNPYQFMMKHSPLAKPPTRV